MFREKQKLLCSLFKPFSFSVIIFYGYYNFTVIVIIDSIFNIIKLTRIRKSI